MLTKREEEIQKLACETLDKIEPFVAHNLDKLANTMELAYYKSQITTRLEILMSLKFGLEPDQPAAKPEPKGPQKKPATRQRIAALMRKAGHSRSKSTPSGTIRGWRTVEAGYVIEEHAGRVRVHYRGGSGDSRDQFGDRREEHLKRYEATLAEAGYQARRAGDKIEVD